MRRRTLLVAVVVSATSLAACAGPARRAPAGDASIGWPPAPPVFAPPAPDVKFHLPRDTGDATNADTPLARQALLAIFDPSSAVATALEHVEDGSRFTDAVTAARSDPRTAGISIDILSIQVSESAGCGNAHAALPLGDCQIAMFVVRQSDGGTVANFPARLVKLGGTWKLTAGNYCDILETIGVACPAGVTR